MALLSSEVDAFAAPGIPTIDSAPTYYVRASVGHRNGVRKLCILDYRVGNIQLSADDALAFARWILDIFADAPECQHRAHEEVVAALREYVDTFTGQQNATFDRARAALAKAEGA